MTLGELVFMIFCIIGAFNALFLSIYIWFYRNKNTVPNILLSVFLVFTAFRIIRLLLTDFQDNFDLDYNFPLFYYSISVSSLVGPLMYLYIRFVSVRNLKFKTPDLLHFLPFLFIFLAQYFLAYKGRYDFNVYVTKHLLVLTQFLIYILVSIRFYKRHLLQGKEGENIREKSNIQIIRNITIIFSLLWILDVFDVIIILNEVHIYTFSYLNIYYSHSPEPVYYSILTYYMLFAELKSGKITKLSSFTSKYGRSALSTEEANKLKNLIVSFMREKKVYKDSNLTLNILAKHLNSTPHILSQLINEQLKYNFNDFINSYRIEEAKTMLSDKGMDNFTIASIAYDCGFNTLSAFNSAFKKFTGSTPSRYRAGAK
jgi:AraC-like DNA-binding protein